MWAGCLRSLRSLPHGTVVQAQGKHSMKSEREIFKTHHVAEGHRILALDVGERRIGVAMSDERGVLATPLTTVQAIPHHQALQDIVALVETYHIQEIVVGLPLTMRGLVGTQAEIVHLFVAELQAVVQLPVHLFDERLTSVLAEQMIHEHTASKHARMRGKDRSKDRSKGKKKHKDGKSSPVDEIAATIILQNFLDRNRNLEALS
jgi:putative holliday junction resolvase